MHFLIIKKEPDQKNDQALFLLLFYHLSHEGEGISWSLIMLGQTFFRRIRIAQSRCRRQDESHRMLPDDILRLW